MAAGLGFDAEDPKLLFTRTFAFSFLLVASPQICELGLNMTSAVIELLQMPDAVDITFCLLYTSIKPCWTQETAVGSEARQLKPLATIAKGTTREKL